MFNAFLFFLLVYKMNAEDESTTDDLACTETIYDQIYDYIDQGVQLREYIQTCENRYEILNDANGPNLETPLIYAILNSTPQVVQTLLDMGANVEGNGGDNPMLMAMRANKLPMVQVLLNAGALISNQYIMHYVNAADTDPDISMAILLSQTPMMAYTYARKGHKLRLFLSQLQSSQLQEILNN